MVWCQPHELSESTPRLSEGDSAIAEILSPY